MNFFEQQDIARRNTRKLIILLGLAIASLIAVTTALFAGVMAHLETGNSMFHAQTAGMSFWQKLATVVSWQTVSGIALVVLTVVFLGGLYKYFQLSRGGRAVAEALGGRLLNTNTQDFNERQLLNVVEEMAIASGTPVPPVYLMEEPSINAFAAGHTPQDAVIGVTRGCIETLNRDELQGVVAHEFSHIFHGDMRLNMRLVALLNGILLLGLIGHFLVRGSAYRSLGRSSKNNSQGAIVGIGIGLMIIGYAGTFFGNLIKAAVSRQREFLADASAVQFTRNNTGIAGALKKIGALPAGSKLQAEHSAEFSHMYFGQGVSTAFNSLMATHPPLDERIRRVEPNWNGTFPTLSTEPQASKTTAGSAQQAKGFSADPVAAFKTAAVATAVDHIGQPQRQDIDSARSALEQMPVHLREAAHEPFSARGLIFGLLLDRDRQARAQQWRALSGHYPNAELNQLADIARASAQVHDLHRLPLIELCMPALKELTASQRNTFFKAMDTLINADHKVNLMEWAIRRILSHQLAAASERSGTLNLRQLHQESVVLLSFLAYAGGQDGAQTHKSFAAACKTLGLPPCEPLGLAQLDTALLDRALTKLNRVKPLQKPQLLKAMIACIEHDGQVSAAEAELFRAVADSLNCPVPPLRADHHP